MYYYDDKGEIAWTTDTERARRQHVATMLSAATYPLNPDAAGSLAKRLGFAPAGTTRQEAIARIQSVLRELGLGSVPIKSALEIVDKSWHLAVTVGT